MSELYVTGFENRSAEKLLASRGVSFQDMPPKKLNFSVDEALVKIEPEIPGVIAKNITINKQRSALATVFKNPLKTPFVMGISSFPSDQRAKYLATNIMMAACLAYNRDKRSGRELPLWHRVFAGFQDTLRDRSNTDSIPSLIVISNVTIDSSSIKLEKVRDILEKFPDVPRIVVMGGEPPSNLFANRLNFPMTIGIYLGPDSRIKTV